MTKWKCKTDCPVRAELESLAPTKNVVETCRALASMLLSSKADLPPEKCPAALLLPEPE